MPTVTVIVSQDRTDRNPDAGYRFHLWDEHRDHYATSRASDSASGAQLDAERLFGPLHWITEPTRIGITQKWVLCVALVNARGKG
jgi:hypothetical protein